MEQKKCPVKESSVVRLLMGRYIHLHSMMLWTTLSIYSDESSDRHCNTCMEDYHFHRFGQKSCTTPSAYPMSGLNSVLSLPTSDLIDLQPQYLRL